MTLVPEKVTACIKELAQWFAEHRTEADFGEMEPIMMKHFPSAADRSEFNAYILSPEGRERFRKQLRLEAWQSVFGGEEETFRFGAKPEEKFPLGRLVMTRGVDDLVAENKEFALFVMNSLQRHASGDWGDLSEEDKKENEYALGRHLRLFSAYERPPLFPKIWIITEADRSVTTILFPSEY